MVHHYELCRFFEAPRCKNDRSFDGLAVERERGMITLEILHFVSDACVLNTGVYICLRKGLTG